MPTTDGNSRPLKTRMLSSRPVSKGIGETSTSMVLLVMRRRNNEDKNLVAKHSNRLNPAQAQESESIDGERWVEQRILVPMVRDSDSESESTP
ncbi:hypothetical protein AJ79_03827 [Helicocarpus griseus UAMH5409]|uniref:Uncharacterized protein n=1 Tax=Helicocarpus griseus UAMH5409 TaxID=1447875 RepID=A0A2B7XVT5_9EURO|nr:hypothetical protein AJ79_03827 [Helicocarpus griseus UAMH5409]